MLHYHQVSKTSADRHVIGVIASPFEVKYTTGNLDNSVNYPVHSQ